MSISRLVNLVLTFPLLACSHVCIANSVWTDDEIEVTGRLISAEPAAGCGIIIFGSPLVYQIVSGPKSLIGKKISILVACIEMPLIQGNVKTFVVGATQELTITKQNIRKIEIPAALPDASWFYLKSATTFTPRPN